MELVHPHNWSCKWVTGDLNLTYNWIRGPPSRTPKRNPSGILWNKPWFERSIGSGKSFANDVTGLPCDQRQRAEARKFWWGKIGRWPSRLELSWDGWMFSAHLRKNQNEIRTWPSFLKRENSTFCKWNFHVLDLTCLCLPECRWFKSAPDAPKTLKLRTRWPWENNVGWNRV